MQAADKNRDADINHLFFLNFYLTCRHATGGSISGVLDRLSDAELNVTQSVNNTGNVRYFPRVQEIHSLTFPLIGFHVPVMDPYIDV